MSVTDWAAVFVAVAVPAIAWVFSRISKARQGETHDAITEAVESMKIEVLKHVDDQVALLQKSLDRLSTSVEAVDEREMETRTQVATLKGRVDEMRAQTLGRTPTAQPQR